MNIIDIVDQLPRHPTKRYKQRDVADIRQIIVHCSATAGGTPEAFANHHITSPKLQYPGIGYHYCIAKDGTVYKTQNATTISYQAKGANTHGLGVCMVGNFDVTTPTPQQWQSLWDLLKELCRAYKVTAENVIGHREVPGTHKSCPGHRVDMDMIRERLKGGRL